MGVLNPPCLSTARPVSGFSSSSVQRQGALWDSSLYLDPTSGPIWGPVGSAGPRATRLQLCFQAFVGAGLSWPKLYL